VKTGGMAAENSALQEENIKIEKFFFKCNNISQYYCFFTVFLIK